MMQISTFNKKKNKKWLFIGMFTTFGEIYNLYNINFLQQFCMTIILIIHKEPKIFGAKKKSK